MCDDNNNKCLEYSVPASSWVFSTRYHQMQSERYHSGFHLIIPHAFNSTHHMIQDTSTMVASLKALKKRMSSSPSSPSFLSATPNTMANNTRPRMFMPSVSVPIGTYKKHTQTRWRFQINMENQTKRERTITQNVEFGLLRWWHDVLLFTWESFHWKCR